MYPNLIAEMARYGITQVSIAHSIGKRAETINSWLRGRGGGFDIHDALKIRDEFFPTCDIQYLFSQEPAPFGPSERREQQKVQQEREN